MRLGRALCGDLEQAERREWWIANGLGGYAGGTLAGILTRRYHGLLARPRHPASRPPPGLRQSRCHPGLRHAIRSPCSPTAGREAP